MIHNRFFQGSIAFVLLVGAYFAVTHFIATSRYDNCIETNLAEKKHENVENEITQACFDLSRSKNEKQENKANCVLNALSKADKDNPVSASRNISRACEIIQIIGDEEEEKILNCIIDKTLTFRMGRSYMYFYDECEKEIRT